MGSAIPKLNPKEINKNIQNSNKKELKKRMFINN
jgi:hypothetical protein